MRQDRHFDIKRRFAFGKRAIEVENNQTFLLFVIRLTSYVRSQSVLMPA